jgi:hypothetical protein
VDATRYWQLVVRDRSSFLLELLERLREAGIRYAVIGGQGVNAYADPVVSLDLDLAVAADDVTKASDVLGRHFRVEAFPHSLNVSHRDSDLRVQIQRDPRYFDFVERSSIRNVLGLQLPVADARDVLRGKIWAVEDPARRASKRLKDLSDIARLLEVRPELRNGVPPEILERLK